jgi:CubicO group peptidase (beta-lactamase class C family)
MKSRVLVVTLAVMVCSLRGAEPENLAGPLERIREAHHLPALAAAAVDDGVIVGLGAAGHRRANGTELVTNEDQWHLGSCTKSMTAAVAAMLVEDGYLQWDITIGEVFPDLSDSMKPEWKDVTLEQLLFHRAGAPHDPPEDIWKKACERIGTPTEQRFEFIKGILSHQPEKPPGTHWIYSDSGYAIVGAMMERVTGEAWEDLMRKRLFAPLGLKSAGFGEPASPGQVDQPWGHRGDEPPFQPVPPGPEADNPPAIGPAATVHMSIADFAHYAAWQVAGARGSGSLLSPSSFKKLHTPPPGQKYAMGWVIMKRRWANGTALMHQGENEMFYAVMWLGLGQNTCFVAACNADGRIAEEACDDAIAMMINSF